MTLNVTLSLLIQISLERGDLCLDSVNAMCFTGPF